MLSKTLLFKVLSVGQFKGHTYDFTSFSSSLNHSASSPCPVNVGGVILEVTAAIRVEMFRCMGGTSGSKVCI